MSEDLYTKILNLPEGERPPHYYDLLGIDLFKVDKKVIDNAALGRVKKLQEWQLHPDQKSVQIIFEQVSVACIVLKSPVKKREYDIQLSRRLGIEFSPEEISIEGDASNLAEELKRLIQNNVCPVCSFENEKIAKFCGNCGAGLKRNCPECDTELSIHNQYCISCGTDVDGFRLVENIFRKIETLKHAMNWSQIVEEYSFMPENPRLPGDKGKEILATLNNLKEKAEANQDKISDLQAELKQALAENNDAKALEIARNWLTVSDDDKVNRLVGELSEKIKAHESRKNRIIFISAISVIGGFATIFIIIAIVINNIRQSEYQQIIEEANEFRMQQNWEQAVSAYKKAMTVPGYGYDRNARNALAEIEEKINEYNNSLSEAERCLKTKQFNLAKKSFQRVLKMPGYENDKTTLEGLIKVENGIKAEYAPTLSKAKECLSKQNWEQARILYKQVLKFPGCEKDKDCTEGLKKAEAMIKKYTAVINAADHCLSQKDYQKAAELFKRALNIPGFKHDKIALAGLKKVEAVEAQLKNAMENENKAKREKIIKKLAPYLIKGQWKIALLKFKKLPDNNSFPEIKTVLTQLDDADKAIIDDFRADIGRNISLNIRGKIRTVTIRSVTGREICYVGGKKERYIDLEDLSGSDKINRLPRMNSIAKAIYLGVDALKRGKYEIAKKYFVDSGDFSKVLIGKLLDMKSVTASKLIIWNQHNSHHNNTGTLKCNIKLFLRGNEVWRKDNLRLTWKPDRDCKDVVNISGKRFDKIRIEILKWHDSAGGLAEVQVIKGKRNIAKGCPCRASEEHLPGDGRTAMTLTDGITTSKEHCKGYWLLPVGKAGWAEMDLSNVRN